LTYSCNGIAIVMILYLQRYIHCIGVASYGALGNVPPRLPTVIIFFWSLPSRTSSNIGLCMVAYPEKNIQAYSFVTVIA